MPNKLTERVQNRFIQIYTAPCTTDAVKANQVFHKIVRGCFGYLKPIKYRNDYNFKLFFFFKMSFIQNIFP